MVYIMCYVYCELHYEYVKGCYEHLRYVYHDILMNTQGCYEYHYNYEHNTYNDFITIILHNHQMIMIYITCIVAIDEWLH